MKYLNIKRKYSLFVYFLSLTVMFFSCNDDDEYGDLSRIFSPVVNTLEANGNTIYAKWSNDKSAVDYTIELSRDTFQTIDRSEVITASNYTFTGLDWETSYQIRVKANNEDPEKSSKYTWLQNKDVKIGTFLGILVNPTSESVIDNAAKVQWNENKSDALTRLEVRLTSWKGEIFKEITFNEQDYPDREMIVDGLDPATKYAIMIYSGDELRGYAYYGTKAAITAEYVVDLRDSPEITSLKDDFFAGLEPGTVVLLEGGKTYQFNGGLTGSITLMSAYSFDGRATLESVGGLTTVDNAQISKIMLQDVNITGDASGYTGRYIFNFNKVAKIDTILIESCNIDQLRGICRTQAGPEITEVKINNCVIDSINGYGLINCDNASSSIKRMILSKSTVINAQKVFVNSKADQTVYAKIQDCTFYMTPTDKAYIMDFKGMTVPSVVVKNNIFGPSWVLDATPEADRGFRYFQGNLTFDSGNNYYTEDVLFSSTVTEDTTFPGTSKTVSSSLLWEKPKDDNFTVKTSLKAGDPRWLK